jgi:hypothetical protein
LGAAIAVAVMENLLPKLNDQMKHDVSKLARDDHDAKAATFAAAAILAEDRKNCNP